MKSTARALLFLTLLVAAALPARADMAAKNKAEAAAVIKKFGGALKKELQTAMKAGGPMTAIAACNLKAPAIADTHSAGPWTVARTSLKIRNPVNEPDAWEREILAMFEAKKAAGTPVGRLAHAEVVTRDGKKTFRFMKALPTAGLCLNCHGGNLKPEVAAKLNELYPDDKARGYKAGDIRGAFSLEKPL